MTQPKRESWYEYACTGPSYSPEDYYFCVEGYVHSRRFDGTAHQVDCDLGRGEPNYPELHELKQMNVDTEVLARQLYDGINAAMVGQVLKIEGGNAWRLNIVLKCGTVAEVNEWMSRCIAGKGNLSAAA